MGLRIQGQGAEAGLFNNILAALQCFLLKIGRDRWKDIKASGSFLEVMGLWLIYILFWFSVKNTNCVIGRPKIL